MNQIFTLKELNKIAQNLINKAQKNKINSSVIITISGDLGSGKTTLTQEIGRILGVKEKIISPTFVIMKKYKINNKDFKYLIHIDAYRLENSQELIKLGWQEIVENDNNLIIMEWPEIVPDCMNRGVIIKVFLEHKDKEKRKIKTLL